MYRLLGFLPCLLAGLAFTPAQAGEAQLRAFLDQVQSLQADFEQTLYDEDLNRIEDSAGRFYLQRPGRFRWDYSTPYVQEIVADGEQVWIYDSELAQVTVKTLDQTLGNTPALLLSSDAPLEDNFVLKDVGLQDGLDWVALTPRAAESTFSTVRLGFDGQVLRAMELSDNFGQITQLRFSATQRNPRLAPDLFRFTPPPGVDVIGDTAQ